MQISLLLPWPPSVNHYWKPWRGRIIVSKVGRDYWAAAKERIASARARGTCPQEKLRKRLRLDVVLHAPTGRDCDVDNFNKAPLDAMTKAGVYVDDKLIDKLVVDRGEPIDGGAWSVRITELN